MRKLRTLILEPKGGERSHFDRYEDFFREVGYEYERTFADNGDQVLDWLSDPAREHWYVFICDLSLGSRSAPTGHRVVRRVKDRFPEHYCPVR